MYSPRIKVATRHRGAQHRYQRLHRSGVPGSRLSRRDSEVDRVEEDGAEEEDGDVSTGALSTYGATFNSSPPCNAAAKDRLGHQRARRPNATPL